MSKPTKNSVDIHVGRRLRVRRAEIGMNQVELADLVGVAFQQVHKYETGANRMGASRLFEVAKALGVPVQYFFDELPGETRNRRRSKAAAAAGPTPDFASSAEGRGLTQSFVRIKSARVRRRILALVTELAAADEA